MAKVSPLHRPIH